MRAPYHSRQRGNHCRTNASVASRRNAGRVVSRGSPCACARTRHVSTKQARAPLCASRIHNPYSVCDRSDSSYPPASRSTAARYKPALSGMLSNPRRPIAVRMSPSSLGLATRNYAIIEQGRVGEIVSSRPESRRQFIEENALNATLDI